MQYHNLKPLIISTQYKNTKNISENKTQNIVEICNNYPNFQKMLLVL